jgi:hypothetical protein
MASSPTAIEKVLEKEIETIHARRREAGIEEYQAESEMRVPLEDTRDSLVGLALSGGGVRSGAFCIGMIQALYSSGRAATPAPCFLPKSRNPIRKRLIGTLGMTHGRQNKMMKPMQQTPMVS